MSIILATRQFTILLKNHLVKTILAYTHLLRICYLEYSKTKDQKYLTYINKLKENLYQLFLLAATACFLLQDQNFSKDICKQRKKTVKKFNAFIEKVFEKV